MYIKFKKKHPVGIEKGMCKKVDANVGEDFINDKYAEEISEADYKEWLEDYKSNLGDISKKAEMKAVDLNEKRDNGSGEIDPRTLDEKEEEKEVEEAEVEYHELTDEDLKAYPSETQGMTSAHEGVEAVSAVEAKDGKPAVSEVVEVEAIEATLVELNSEGAFITGANGLFVVKGNSEASSNEGGGEPEDGGEDAEA